MEQLSTIQILSVYILPILFAITVHEVAHAWVANKLGDKTAYLLGRITLNPFKHIDLIGTVLVPILFMLFGGIMFGWARPVPINFANLKHPRRDIVLVSWAGPLSNFVMALLWGLVAKLGMILQVHYPWFWLNALFYMGQAGIQINLVFMVLNLIPIPPLDGGKIFLALLPSRLAIKFSRIEPYGFIIVLVLFVAGILNYIIYPLVVFLSKFIVYLFHL